MPFGLDSINDGLGRASEVFRWAAWLPSRASDPPAWPSGNGNEGQGLTELIWEAGPERWAGFDHHRLAVGGADVMAALLTSLPDMMRVDASGSVFGYSRKDSSVQWDEKITNDSFIFAHEVLCNVIDILAWIRIYGWETPAF